MENGGLFIYIPFKGPSKNSGWRPPSGVSELSGCLEVINNTLLSRKKMYPIT